MSVLRQVHRELESGNPFTLEGLANGLHVALPKNERVGGFFGAVVYPTKVTKTDPIEEALQRLLEESAFAPHAELGQDPTKKRKRGFDLGLREASELFEDNQFLPAHKQKKSLFTTTLRSRDSHRTLGELTEQHARGDCEQVDFEGTLRLEAEELDVELSIRAKLWPSHRGIEMAVCLFGFGDTPEELWYELSGFSACQDLQRLRLSDHKLLFVSAPTLWSDPLAIIQARAGLSAMMTVELLPNLAAHVETNTPDKRLLLYGAIPDGEAPDLLFVTAPLFTLGSGRLLLSDAYVRVRARTIFTMDEGGFDSFRDTEVQLVGLADVGGTRRLLQGPLPRDHSLLQLRMEQSLFAKPLDALSEADDLMGGDLWRRVWCDRLPEPKEPCIDYYHHNALLPSGKVTSLNLNLLLSAYTLKLNEEVSLHFPSPTLRCVVGLPDEPSTHNVHLVAEGELRIVGPAGPIGPAFEGSILFAPELGVLAAAEAVSLEAIETIHRALWEESPPPPIGAIGALRSPARCSIALSSTKTLTCVGPDGARVTWRSE